MGSAYRLGIVGLGVISKTYLENLALSEDLEITALADLDVYRAELAATYHPGARVMTVAELVASNEVDAVLNLTVPDAHAEISLAAIRAGKLAYSEKPFAANLSDALLIMDEAKRSGIRVGCAPDTVLGTGVQTARQIVESGKIGRPIAATAIMATPGHELWHPNPDFYYTLGGGPLLDMGPYYVSALVHLLGPVKSVSGMASAMRQHRVIGSGQRQGEKIPVSAASHVTGLLEHDSGALSTIIMSFDSASTQSPPIEVHGELGTISVPDPNGFHGINKVRMVGDDTWTEIQPSSGFQDGDRGVGLLDLIRGKGDSPILASGDLALHVLEIMLRLLDSTETGVRTSIDSRVNLAPIVPFSSGFNPQPSLAVDRGLN